MPQGSLNETTSSVALDEFSRVALNGHDTIWVFAEGLQTVTPEGAHALIVAAKLQKSAGRSFHISGASKSIQKLFSGAGVGNFIELFFNFDYG